MNMSKMIKTSLVALSILAGASIGYAGDKGRDGNMGHFGPFGQDGRPENRESGPDIWEQNNMIDPGTTGSIVRCDTGSYDEFGNCIAGPDLQ
jgi:hypothetical protein